MTWSCAPITGVPTSGGSGLLGLDNSSVHPKLVAGPPKRFGRASERL
jgi:hypothetical protein